MTINPHQVPTIQILLDREQTAVALCTSPRHVRRLIETERLPSVKLGGKIRVRAVDLEVFVSQLTRPSRAVDCSSDSPALVKP